MKIKKEFLPEAFSGWGSFSAAAVLILFLSLPLVAADESAASVSPSQDSLDYALVGIAHFDGISFASLIDRQTKIHFLLSSDKPQDGLKLISVAGDESSAGPSAIIEKGGISVQLKVEAGEGTDQSISVVSSSSSSSNQAAILPPPAPPKSDLPSPPPGTSLPLVFQAVDPKKLNLSPDQQQAIDQLRHDFLSAIKSTGQGNSAQVTNTSTASNAVTSAPATSTSPESNSPASSPDTGSASTMSPPVSGQGITPNSTAQQINAWQSAQEQSDELLRTTIGWQAFSQYQLSLIK